MPLLVWFFFLLLLINNPLWGEELSNDLIKYDSNVMIEYPVQINSNTNRSKMSVDGKSLILNLVYEKKDPYVAAVFSVVYSGIGQFYNGSFTKGSLFFLSETVYYAFYWGLNLKFKNFYMRDSIDFNNLDNGDKALLLSSFVLYLSMKVFCIYDAYTSAQNISDTIDKSLNQISISADIRDWKIRCTTKF